MQGAQHGGDIVVQLAMPTRCPFPVDLTCDRVERVPCSTHGFDDVPGVPDVDLVVVHSVLGQVEQSGGALDRTIEQGSIDLDAVTRAERTVSLALKRGARVDEGEVDVEEYGSGHLLADSRTGRASAGLVIRSL